MIQNTPFLREVRKIAQDYEHVEKTNPKFGQVSFISGDKQIHVYPKTRTVVLYTPKRVIYEDPEIYAVDMMFNFNFPWKKSWFMKFLDNLFCKS